MFSLPKKSTPSRSGTGGNRDLPSNNSSITNRITNNISNQNTHHTGTPFRQPTYPSLLFKNTSLNSPSTDVNSLSTKPIPSIPIFSTFPIPKTSSSQTTTSIPPTSNVENHPNSSVVDTSRKSLIKHNKSVLLPSPKHIHFHPNVIDPPETIAKPIPKFVVPKRPTSSDHNTPKTENVLNPNTCKFQPPPKKENKRKFEEPSNQSNKNRNSKYVESVGDNETKSSTKKEKKRKADGDFHRILFAQFQKELSQQPLSSTIVPLPTPLTPSPETNGLSMFGGSTKPIVESNANHMALYDSQDSINIDEIEDIISNEMENAIKILYQTRLAKTLSDNTKEKYLKSLLNSSKITMLGYEDLFGENYPSIGSLTLKDKKAVFKLLSNGSLTNINESTGRSIYHSYSRLARNLMGFHLGKAMIFVNFSEDGWDDAGTRDCIENTCLDGICYAGNTYKFFGTSNSGINGHTALFLDTRLNFAAVKDLLGDFTECAKSGPRKVFSRIGLSLGKSYMSKIELQDDELFVLHDEDNYPGVDGAGFMREDYFRLILENTNVAPFFEKEINRDGDSKCSILMECDIGEVVAMQFRALGMKGVFQSIPEEYWSELKTKYGFSDSVKCVARPSMMKFEGNREIYRNFDILNISRIQGGSINRTFMSCMLRRTKRRAEMQNLFVNMLDEYIKNESNINSPKFLYNHVLSCGVFDNGDSVYKTVKSLILAGVGMENPFVFKYIKKRIKAKFQSLIDNKLSLKMKSRFSVTLMGVIDESGELHDDEVYVPCFKLQEELKREFYKLNQVIVYRHPLAYEEDIIKLKLRKDPVNSFLASRSNVIVFPKVFQKKSPHQYLAGGDLDGDAYEVVFDMKLIELLDRPAKHLDYDEGKQSASAMASQPLVALSHDDVIKEHVKCFINKHAYTGLLFYYNTIARDLGDGELKAELAKAYSHSIDSMKGSEIDFEKLINKSKKQLTPPLWYQQWKTVKVSSWKPGSDINTNIFENLMLCKVVDAYQKMTLVKPTEIDPDLIWTDPDCTTMEKIWAHEFENAYKEWNTYWRNFKKTTNLPSQQIEFTFNDRFFSERINNILSNYAASNTQQHEPNWNQMFLANTFAKNILCKASYWLRLAFEKENQLIENYQNGKSTFKKSILKSPFLYMCITIPVILMLKNRESKYPSTIHPSLKVKLL